MGRIVMRVLPRVLSLLIAAPSLAADSVVARSKNEYVAPTSGPTATLELALKNPEIRPGAQLLHDDPVTCGGLKAIPPAELLEPGKIAIQAAVLQTFVSMYQLEHGTVFFTGGVPTMVMPARFCKVGVSWVPTVGARYRLEAE